MSEFLFDQYGDQKILAERAKKDINGLSLELTVTDDKVTAIGGYEVGGGQTVDAYTKSETDDLLADKVDVESGKGLSTEDYTTSEKNKLAGIEAGAEKNVHADWTATSYDDPGFIVGKPNVPAKDDFNYESFSRQSPYNYNCHVITQDDLTNKYFYIALPLTFPNIQASSVMLLGDIYGFRIVGDGNARTVTSMDVSSIDLMLGGNDGRPISNMHYIRRIDASDFVLSDVNSSLNVDDYNTSPSQCRFHFMHMGASSRNMMPITDKAYNLLIRVNIATSPLFVAGEKFEIHVAWVQF